MLATLAKRGEPSTPHEPAKGEVWSSIATNFSDVGFENEYISVARVARELLAKHPWSLGGGGATDLKELLEERASARLGDVVSAIGFSVVTGEDNTLVAPREVLHRDRVDARHMRRLVIGEEVRDWAISEGGYVLWPCRSTGERLRVDDVPDVVRRLWPYRTVLRDRKAFGVPVEVKGIPWWALREVYHARMKTPLTITFAFVATHNHFVLDRGDRVFGRSAPIIKLPETATEDDHLALLAYLNSSTAAFYFRQAGHSKGAQGVNEGHKSEQWEQFLEYSGALVASLPVPRGISALTELGRRADCLAQELTSLRPEAILAASGEHSDATLMDAEKRYRAVFRRLVATQEAIDWETYRLFGLVDQVPELPDELEPGSRPFEYFLAKEVGATTWFERNRYDVARSATSERAIELIRSSRELALLERPEHKHRWTVIDYQEAVTAALISARQRRLEKVVAEQPSPQTRVDIARHASLEPEVISSLLGDDAVPFLSVARFTESGFAKHAEWLQCWDEQRKEDRSEPSRCEVPPKYNSNDYSRSRYWQLRGKLDVPKERFISYPYCESDVDGEPVYGWAGWDHLQRAHALGTLYLKRRDEEGWTAERLTPMLAGLLELIPWLKQWHNEPSAEFDGQRMGDYYENFLNEECRRHHLTYDDLRAWRPPKKSRGSAKGGAKPRAVGRSEGDAEGAAPADNAAPAPSRKPRKRNKKGSVAEVAAAPEAD